MKVSIIIPTLNEEKYLPLLLKSIKKQRFKDYEIIVADANSKDKTLEIAQKYGAKVVKGGLPGVGRNRGAKIAQGEFLFFLDADVILPRNFLKKAYNEMQKRYLDLATCEFKPISNLLIDKVSHELINLFIKLSQFSTPHAPGFSIFVSKRLFERVGGFDESIKIAEDHDFVRRASKLRPLRILESTYIKVSVRRLEKEGRIRLAKKYLYVELHRLFKGELKKDIINYEFGNYNQKKDKFLRKRLKQLERQLSRLNKSYKKIVKDYLKKERLTENYKKKFNNLKKQFYKLKNRL